MGSIHQKTSPGSMNGPLKYTSMSEKKAAAAAAGIVGSGSGPQMAQQQSKRQQGRGQSTAGDSQPVHIEDGDAGVVVMLPGGKTASGLGGSGGANGTGSTSGGPSVPSFRAMAAANLPPSGSKIGVTVQVLQQAEKKNIKFGGGPKGNIPAGLNIPPRTHSAPPALDDQSVSLVPPVSIKKEVEVPASIQESALSEEAAKDPPQPQPHEQQPAPSVAAAPAAFLPQAHPRPYPAMMLPMPYGYAPYMPHQQQPFYGSRPPYMMRPPAAGMDPAMMGGPPAGYYMPPPTMGGAAPSMFARPPLTSPGYISYRPGLPPRPAAAPMALSPAAASSIPVPAKKKIAIVNPETGEEINIVKAAIPVVKPPEPSITTATQTSALPSPKKPAPVVITDPDDNKPLALPPKPLPASHIATPPATPTAAAAAEDDPFALESESDIFSDAHILDDEDDDELASDEDDDDEPMYSGPRLLRFSEQVDYPRTMVPFTPPPPSVGVWRYDRTFLLQFQRICTWKLENINLEIPIMKVPKDQPGRRSSEYRSRGDRDRERRKTTAPLVGGTPAVLTNRAADAWQRLGEKVMPEDQKILREVKGMLNKLTFERFDAISDKLISFGIMSKAIMPGTIDLIFDKAVEEPKFASMYARLCLKIVLHECELMERERAAASASDGTVSDAPSASISGATFGKSEFRKFIVSKCQVEYEKKRAWSQERLDRLSKDKEAAVLAGDADVATDAAAATAATEIAAVKPSASTGELTEEDYARIRLKRRVLGNMRFIGELYNVNLISEKIMHAVIVELLSNSGNPEEEEIESLCKLFTTVGPKLDTPAASKQIESYLGRMALLTENLAMCTRVRFMVLDVLDHRKARWTTVERDVPKSLNDLQKEIEAKQQQQERERSDRDSRHRRRGTEERDRRSSGTPLSTTSASAAGPRPTPSPTLQPQQHQPQSQGQSHLYYQSGSNMSNTSVASSTGGAPARTFQSEEGRRRTSQHHQHQHQQSSSRYSGFSDTKAGSRHSPVPRAGPSLPFAGNERGDAVNRPTSTNGGVPASASRGPNRYDILMAEPKQQQQQQQQSAKPQAQPQQQSQPQPPAPSIKVEEHPADAPWDAPVALGRLVSAFSEYLRFKKPAEFMEVWTAEIPPAHYPAALAKLISVAMDKGEASIDALAADLLRLLVDSGVGPAPVLAAVADAFSMLDDLAVDLPRAFEHAGRLSAALINLGVLKPADLLSRVLGPVGEREPLATAKVSLWAVAHLKPGTPATATPNSKEFMAALTGDEGTKAAVSKQAIKSRLLNQLPAAVEAVVFDAHFAGMPASYEGFLQEARPAVLEVFRPAGLAEASLDSLLFSFGKAAFARLHVVRPKNQAELEGDRLPALLSVLSTFPPTAAATLPLLNGLTAASMPLGDLDFFDQVFRGLLNVGIVEPAVYRDWREDTQVDKGKALFKVSKWIDTVVIPMIPAQTASAEPSDSED